MSKGFCKSYHAVAWILVGMKIGNHIEEETPDAWLARSERYDTALPVTNEAWLYNSSISYGFPGI